jgi:hypothetical protein
MPYFEVVVWKRKPFHAVQSLYQSKLVIFCSSDPYLVLGFKKFTSRKVASSIFGPQYRNSKLSISLFSDGGWAEKYKGYTYLSLPPSNLDLKWFHIQWYTQYGLKRGTAKFPKNAGISHDFQTAGGVLSFWPFWQSRMFQRMTFEEPSGRLDIHISRFYEGSSLGWSMPDCPQPYELLADAVLGMFHRLSHWRLVGSIRLSMLSTPLCIALYLLRLDFPALERAHVVPSRCQNVVQPWCMLPTTCRMAISLPNTTTSNVTADRLTGWDRHGIFRMATLTLTTFK